MQLISLNVGKPRPFNYKGRTGNTSIFKSPVDGSRQVSTTNIEGDKQGDLVSHGGKMKAVYSYDISYYQHWKNILQWDDWNYGLFGENLTTEGMPDDQVFVGNVYRIGSVYLRAVQPRFPCYKLNIRFNNNDLLQKFTDEEKNGTYFSVVETGSLQAGDTIELVEQSPHKVTIEQLVKSYYSKGPDKEIVKQVLAIDFLPERLRKAFLSFKD